MSTVQIIDIISVEDYIEGELVSSVKHEYVAVAVFAMAGGSNAHNRIAVRIFNRQPSHQFSAS